MRFMVGFRPVIEADEGYWLGGRMIDDGPVFERFCEALDSFNAVIALNLEAGRSVKQGRIEPFRGMVSALLMEGESR